MQSLSEKAGSINLIVEVAAGEGLQVQVGLAQVEEVAGVAVGAVASPEAVEVSEVAEAAVAGEL